MDQERDLTHGPGGFPAPNDIPDEVFKALVRLTELRLAGKTLADLSATEADWLILMLGRDEIEEMLQLDLFDLVVHEHGTNGFSPSKS